MRSVRALVPDSRGWSRIFMMSPSLTWVIYRNRRCRWTNYHFSANNAAHGHPSYGVAAARSGWDVCRGQETVPQYPAGKVFLLQQMDKMRYVSSCGYVSLRLGTVVAVPGVLVHGVEGHVSGLHGSCSGEHDVPWKVKSASLEQFFPVDSSAPGLVGFPYGQSFLYFN